MSGRNNNQIATYFHNKHPSSKLLCVCNMHEYCYVLSWIKSHWPSSMPESGVDSSDGDTYRASPQSKYQCRYLKKKRLIESNLNTTVLVLLEKCRKSRGIGNSLTIMKMRSPGRGGHIGYWIMIPWTRNMPGKLYLETYSRSRKGIGTCKHRQYTNMP